MDFSQVVSTRRSVRAFRPDPVESAPLVTILETANRAPSAGNLQAFVVHLVREPDRLIALAAAAFGQDFIAQAPLALVFCADPKRSAARYGRRGAGLYSVQDATIACAYAQLAAVDLGLATVWVGAFDDDGVRRVIGVGPELPPVAVLPLGYPAEEPPPTPRRPLKRLVVGW